MADKLRAGTPADLVILTQALLAKLAAEKLVVPSSIADVGRVETALAVRNRDPKVTVKTEADLREVLRIRGCHLRSGHQSLDRGTACRKSAGSARHRL